MAKDSGPTFSVSGLFAERGARRRQDTKAEEQLKRKQQEELSAFKQRLEDFWVTGAHVQAVLSRIRRAFKRGENELVLTSFPSNFCSDSGRAITYAGAPPITKRDPKQTAEQEPEWLATLPAGGRRVYEYWKDSLKPGGFSFTAHIINYPGGMSGDVGLFFSWPKSTIEI